MRGADEQPGSMFSYVSLEERVPKDLYVYGHGVQHRPVATPVAGERMMTPPPPVAEPAPGLFQAARTSASPCLRGPCALMNATISATSASA